MKQEFLNGQIVLYNADCVDVMRNIGDKEIDLVLTDPPYGIGVDGGIGSSVLAKKSDFEKACERIEIELRQGVLF